MAIEQSEARYVVVDPAGTPIGLPKATIGEAESFRELYGRTWLPLIFGTDEEAQQHASLLTVQPVHPQAPPTLEQHAVNGTMDDQKPGTLPPTSTTNAGYVDVFTYMQRYRAGELSVPPEPPHPPSEKVIYNLWG